MNNKFPLLVMFKLFSLLTLADQINFSNTNKYSLYAYYWFQKKQENLRLAHRFYKVGPSRTLTQVMAVLSDVGTDTDHIKTLSIDLLGLTRPMSRSKSRQLFHIFYKVGK
jgi:hypothetical protein